VTGATVPALHRSAHNIVTLDVQNRGWARAYRKYDLKIRLRGADGSEYVLDTDTDNRTWLSGQKKTIALRPDLRDIPAGKYEVAIGMFEGDKTVKLALKQEIFDGRFYTIAKDITVF
ncbi:MAG: DUF4832 domain-containing protein, partial [Clostridia bacterium]|nr:DUF4832 domain-containing protein [Clostridia bacterium]